MALRRGWFCYMVGLLPRDLWQQPIFDKHGWMKITYLIFGFAAGVLSLLTLILFLYLGLAVFGLFFTLLRGLTEAEATGATPLGDHTLLEFITSSLVGSGRNAVLGLWDARWSFVITGVLGVIAAGGHQVGLVLYGKKAWLVSFILVAAGITIPVITWAFVQREAVALWILESPELFNWRDLLLESYATEISVTLLFSLAIAYPVWVVWRWWYVRLTGWLLPGTRGFETPETSRLKQLGQSKKFILGIGFGFVLCVLLLFPINRYHNRVALHLQHDIAWVDETLQQEHAFVVEVKPGARKIRVVNINGVGAVSVYLSPSPDYREAVQSVEEWSFEWRLDDYLYIDVPVTEVEPGKYYLHFLQESGWGYFEYTLGDGGGPASHVAAVAFGFLLACSLILGLILCLLIGIKYELIDVEK